MLAPAAGPALALTLDELVTMPAGTTLSDGFEMADTRLAANSSNSPSRLFVWDNPLDLATRATITFTADGTMNGAKGLCWVPETGFLYMPFRAFDTGTRWNVKIERINPVDRSHSTWVTADYGDSSLVFSPGAMMCCSDGTNLYTITNGDITLGTCEIRKYSLATGTQVAAQLILGRTRGHPIIFDVLTGKLFYGGLDFSFGFAGWALASDLTQFATTNVAASITVEDDTFVRGPYYWIMSETSNPARIYRVKKDLSTIDPLLTGLAGTAHGFARLNGDLLGLVGIRQAAPKVAIFDMDAVTLSGTIALDVLLANVNDLLRDPTNYPTKLFVSTIDTPSKVARYTITGP